MTLGNAAVARVRLIGRPTATMPIAGIVLRYLERGVSFYKVDLIVPEE